MLDTMRFDQVRRLECGEHAHQGFAQHAVRRNPGPFAITEYGHSRGREQGGNDRVGLLRHGDFHMGLAVRACVYCQDDCGARSETELIHKEHAWCQTLVLTRGRDPGAKSRLLTVSRGGVIDL